MARSSGSIRPFRPPPRATRVAPTSRRPRLDRRRRLRLGGYSALLAGAMGVGLIYWDHRHATPTIEELLPASARAHRRQMGILYGTVGAITVDLEEAMRRADTQVVLVLAVSAAIAGLCFRAEGSADEGD